MTRQGILAALGGEVEQFLHAISEWSFLQLEKIRKRTLHTIRARIYTKARYTNR